jgi:hypothetical protein
MSAPRAPAGPRQRGVAAIELALILPILLALLAFPFFFGRVFWHYTVADKAAHDAARYLACVPVIEMTTSARAVHAVEVAQAIIAAEIGDLHLDAGAVSVVIQCNGLACSGFGAPSYVMASVQLPVTDPFFPDITWQAVGDSGLLLTGQATLPYVGK